ncbi:hypothetical protein Esti_006656 [Eimeria stiedai]
MSSTASRTRHPADVAAAGRRPLVWGPSSSNSSSSSNIVWENLSVSLRKKPCLCLLFLRGSGFEEGQKPLGAPRGLRCLLRAGGPLMRAMGSKLLLRPLLLLLLLEAVLQQRLVRAYTAPEALGSRALWPLSLAAHGDSSSRRSSSSRVSSSSSSSRVVSCSSNPGAFLSMESSTLHPFSSAQKALGGHLDVSPLSSSSSSNSSSYSSSNTADVPPETPEDVKAEIRRRRLSNPLSASRRLQNDSLRLSLLGPKAFAALVGGGPPRGPHSSPAESFAVPVWVMRQAGRYLPEFRAIRAQHKFLTVCRDPLLAAEVTLQPLRRFPQLDAVIVFSDILVLPEAMGMPLSVEEGVGPRFAWRLESPEDIKRLDTSFDVEEQLGYVFDAIYATVEQLSGRVPLIGFCGAPLTLLCYMVEGGGPSKDLHTCKQFLFTYPDAALLLLRDIAAAAAKYLIKQVDAGAQVLQVFDTYAGSFSPEVYRHFGSPFLEEIAEQVSAARPGAPLIAFPKDQALPSLVSSKFAAVSLGWGAQRDAAKALFQRGALLRSRPPLDDPQVKALQGNLDPQILYAPDEVIRQQTAQMVRDFQPGRYVANLGHGMEPGMDPRKLRIFIQAVKDTAAQIQLEYSQTAQS